MVLLSHEGHSQEMGEVSGDFVSEHSETLRDPRESLQPRRRGREVKGSAP